MRCYNVYTKVDDKYVGYFYIQVFNGDTKETVCNKCYAEFDNWIKRSSLNFEDCYYTKA